MRKRVSMVTDESTSGIGMHVGMRCRSIADRRWDAESPIDAERCDWGVVAVGFSASEGGRKPSERGELASDGPPSCPWSGPLRA